MANIKQHADFIWSIAELLRGDYKQRAIPLITSSMDFKMLSLVK